MLIIYDEEVWSLTVEAEQSTNWRCGTKTANRSTFMGHTECQNLGPG